MRLGGLMIFGCFGFVYVFSFIHSFIHSFVNISDDSNSSSGCRISRVFISSSDNTETKRKIGRMRV